MSDEPKLPPKLNLRSKSVVNADSSAKKEPVSPQQSTPPPPVPDVKAQDQEESRQAIKIQPPTESKKQAAEISSTPGVLKITGPGETPASSPQDKVVKPPVAERQPSVKPAGPPSPVKPAAGAGPAVAGSSGKAAEEGKKEEVEEVILVEPVEESSEKAEGGEKVESLSGEEKNEQKLTSKKETSRIPLGSARTPGLQKKTETPKTIRIKPSSPPGALKTPRPATTQEILNAMRGGEEEDSKSKTSRISLESVMSSSQGDEEAKTIRVKAPAAGKPEGGKSELSKTARLDISPPGAEEAPKGGEEGETEKDQPGPTETQKKTIRLKRPTQAPGAVAETPQPGGAGAPQPVMEITTPRLDEPGVVFVIIAAAALVVAAVVVYLFATQASPGLGLSWPGGVS